MITENSKKRVQPEVVIPVRKRTKGPVSVASNIATDGSVAESGEQKSEQNGEEKTVAGRVIQKMEEWIANRATEVDMVDAFLQRVRMAIL